MYIMPGNFSNYSLILDRNENFQKHSESDDKGKQL